MPKLTKTQLEIIAEIEKKGYAVIEHGYNGSGFFGRKGLYGSRRADAAHKLIEAGALKVTGNGTDRDAHRGFSCVAHWFRVEVSK